MHPPLLPHALLPALALCRIQLLEISQYLENYLWPHFEAGLAGPSAYEHLMSMLVMVNQKFREGVPGWACFHAANEVRGWARSGVDSMWWGAVCMPCFPACSLRASQLLLLLLLLLLTDASPSPSPPL